MKRWGAFAALALLGFACSDFKQKSLGDLGEACFGEGSCNGDLLCVDKVCVEPAGDEDTINDDTASDTSGSTDNADASDLTDVSDVSGDDTSNPDDDTADVTDSSDTTDVIPADEDTLTEDGSDLVDDDTIAVDDEADEDTVVTDVIISDVDVHAGMAEIANGNFMMGCNEAVDACYTGDKNNEKPYHDIYLDTFWMDVYEVTNAAYQLCVDAVACVAPHYDDGNCYVWNGTAWGKGTAQTVFRGSQKPVVCVSWAEAKTYCEWAGKRLPTEAEWERAARNGDGRIYPWGNDTPTISHAVYSATNTYDVGSKAAGKSPYNIYDMAGNVWEWLGDWYAADYYNTSPSANPTGPSSGSYRVYRGGGWHSAASDLRVSYRTGDVPGYMGTDVGFRCVAQ